MACSPCIDTHLESAWTACIYVICTFISAFFPHYMNKSMFMVTNSQMHVKLRYSRFFAHQVQNKEKSGAFNVLSDNEKMNHLRERSDPLHLSLEEVELSKAIKRTLDSTGCSVLPAHVAGDWERDTSPSRPCNKRVLRPVHHSKGVLRETNIIIGYAKVCVLKRPASEWSPMGFHWGQEGQRCNYAGGLQMVASLCFKPDSHNIVWMSALFSSKLFACMNDCLAGNSLVWKWSTYSPYVPTLSEIWLWLVDNNVATGTVDLSLNCSVIQMHHMWSLTAEAWRNINHSRHCRQETKDDVMFM